LNLKNKGDFVDIDTRPSPCPVCPVSPVCPVCPPSPVCPASSESHVLVF